MRRVVLTASGGPFRTRPIDSLSSVTPDEACAHPNWVMGRKISVDSATMMNKGLEVIEAHWLFNAAPDQIDVLDSSAEHRALDGGVRRWIGDRATGQPGHAHADCLWAGISERIDAGVSMLDLAKAGRLDFEALDRNRFPCVTLAYDALRRGGTAPAVLNAANRVAVESFLNGQLAFTEIDAVIEGVLSKASFSEAATLEEIHVADAYARSLAKILITERMALRRLKG